ncbi:MAG TPA: hypothetical protein VF194_00380 [Ferrovibrio sp.]|uniref:hypothetical protein n=1 Tax=Ferrovibrio sp. TaxID=1917215 RepID=UPI002ED3C996
MPLTTESEKARREALDLLARVEKDGIAILRRYEAGRDVSARYQDFRRLIEKVDHFYVFIDLVEERLPNFEAEKREALARHLAEIRWRIVIVEVDTTQVFLVRIGEGRRPWPLGSRQFLERRLARLGEIAQFYDQFGEVYDLPALGGAMLTAVGDLLKAQIARAPGLDDFTLHAAFAQAASAALRSATPSVPPSAPRRRPGRRQSAALPRPAGPPAQFRTREQAGRFYAERDAIVAVADACRSAQLSMDDLARKLGVSRPALVLMLSGNDPIASGTLEELRSFVARASAA